MVTAAWDIAAAVQTWWLPGVAHALESVRSGAWLLVLASILSAARRKDQTAQSHAWLPLLAAVIGLASLGNDCRFLFSAGSPTEFFPSQVLDRVLSRNQDLPTHVPAFLLRRHLILVVDPGCAGIDHGLHELVHVERTGKLQRVHVVHTHASRHALDWNAVGHAAGRWHQREQQLRLYRHRQPGLRSRPATGDSSPKPVLGRSTSLEILFFWHLPSVSPLGAAVPRSAAIHFDAS